MGKGNRSKRSQVPPEEHLHLPTHPSYAGSESPPIVDTHTHLLSTFALYCAKYPQAKYVTVYEWVRAMYSSPRAAPPNASSADGDYPRHRLDALVDVWCEAPVLKAWKELADSAGDEKLWGGVQYHFVLGVHPHDAKDYNDGVEQDLLEAMAHPRCVGLGEIGLDYHYDLSDRKVQQEVLIKQLRHAVHLKKPLTIHTREADDDIERILKEEVPQDHPIHVHCFTDTVELARRLLDYFPNLYIGITGVITYSTNQNTSDVIRHLVSTSPPPSSRSPTRSPLRILLETDAPYMTPANLSSQTLSLKSGQRLPFSHSNMIPWTAQFVAEIAGEGWDAARVLEVSRENARAVYGI